MGLELAELMCLALRPSERAVVEEFEGELEFFRNQLPDAQVRVHENGDLEHAPFWNPVALDALLPGSGSQVALAETWVGSLVRGLVEQRELHVPGLGDFHLTRRSRPPFEVIRFRWRPANGNGEIRGRPAEGEAPPWPLHELVQVARDAGHDCLEVPSLGRLLLGEHPASLGRSPASGLPLAIRPLPFVMLHPSPELRASLAR